MSVYLDHNATSPLQPEIFEAMLPFLQNPAGNPSGPHSDARIARAALIAGGDQENRQRGGSGNATAIVVPGKAAPIPRLEMGHKQHYLLGLRDRFEARLADIPRSKVFSRAVPRLLNTVFFGLPYRGGETATTGRQPAGRKPSGSGIERV